MSRTLDDGLVNEAFQLTHFKTKKDLVNFALKELVARKKRKGLLKLQGTVQWQSSLETGRLGNHK